MTKVAGSKVAGSKVAGSKVAGTPFLVQTFPRVSIFAGTCDFRRNFQPRQNRAETRDWGLIMRLSTPPNLPDCQNSFTVAPGEQLSIEVTDLQRKPARIRLTNAPAAECAVKVDGLQRGTIASLAQTIRVRSPEREHSLTIQCPDGNTIERTLAPAAPGALVTVDLSTP